MAKLSNIALVRDYDAEYREIKTWYKNRLERTVPHWTKNFKPDVIGPVWDWNPQRGWLLPEFTIGWDMLAWAGVWLTGPDKAPWAYTMEQARFILWFGAVDPEQDREEGIARFLYNSFVLQRLKGHGKDPLGATLGAIAMVGPWVPYWDKNGELCSRDESSAWVQTMAVSQEQTKNMMKLFPGLISDEARKRYGFQVGKLNIWAMNDTRQLEAITSSPLSIEGGRPTLAMPNETQNWTDSNQGHDMIAALAGNLAKAPKDRPARRLDLCNAYRPGMDSVAQRRREAWESTQGDEAQMREFGLMYDSLEAPESTRLAEDTIDEVISNIRGDSVWIDPKTVKKDILDPSNPPSESRRKWFNQIVAAEDAWLTVAQVDAIEDTEDAIDPADECFMFFDGGKSDDATGIVAVRINDGFTETVGMWQRPPGKRQEDWRAPRDRIDVTVSAYVESHNVVGLWADPSHAKDDETLLSYWDPVVDEWHRRWRDQFRLWAVTGRNGHSTMFDMSDGKNLKRFIQQVNVTTSEIESGAIRFDGDRRMRTHLLNARRAPSRYGMGLSKPHRESRKKIDLAVCLVGGQLGRREYLNSRNKSRGGRIW